MPAFIAVLAIAILGGGYYFFMGNTPATDSPEVQPAPVVVDPPTPSPVVTTAPTPVVVTPSAPTPVPPSTKPVTPPVAPVAPMAGKQKYVDGQYSADGTYVIPNTEIEKMTVSLTLKDGIITAVNFTSSPEESASKFNQGRFRDGYTALVVGKNIDTIALTVVNGASLTSKGFMQALETIKIKAQTPA